MTISQKTTLLTNQIITATTTQTTTATATNPTAIPRIIQINIKIH